MMQVLVSVVLTPLKRTTPTLLFDLGGVVVPWVGFEAVAGLTGLDREAIDDRFQSEPALRRFETGHSTPEEFCAALPATLGLDIAPASVPTLWKSWVLPPYPGVVEAITRLKATHRTACLSNTNALHWAHFSTFFDPDALFDAPMASHHLGAAKPDAEIYAIALERLGVAPGDVWFFEDTRKNLDAAAEAGLRVFPVDRRFGVLPVLEELGLA